MVTASLSATNAILIAGDHEHLAHPGAELGGLVVVDSQ
jgi:hypothetical protein